jgi:hypothetical protein
MKSKSLLIAGLVAVALIFGLNLRHAFNDYGFLENHLAYQIVVQTNSSNTGNDTIPAGGNTGGSQFSWFKYTILYVPCNWSQYERRLYLIEVVDEKHN